MDSKSPEQGQDIMWSLVAKRLRLLKGAQLTAKLEELRAQDLRVQGSRKAALEEQARMQAKGKIDAAARGVESVQTIKTQHAARQWLRALVAQECLRRREQGDYNWGDMVDRMIGSFPDPQLHFGVKAERAQGLVPDLGMRAGNGIED